MEHAVIYNPSLGDEDHIEEQIVFAWNFEANEDAVRHMGFVQGLAELAHSFADLPFRWLELDGSIILLIRLESIGSSQELENGEDDWRSAYWLSCSIDLLSDKAQSKTILRSGPDAMCMALYRIYASWYLHNGSLASKASTLTGRKQIDAYWACALTSWTGVFELGVAGSLEGLRLAPGTLNSLTSRQINEMIKEHSLEDLIVVTSNTSSIVSKGSGSLSDNSLRALQDWLAECSLGPSTTYSVQSGIFQRNSESRWPQQVIASSLLSPEEPRPPTTTRQASTSSSLGESALSFAHANSLHTIPAPNSASEHLRTVISNDSKSSSAHDTTSRGYFKKFTGLLSSRRKGSSSSNASAAARAPLPADRSTTPANTSSLSSVSCETDTFPHTNKPIAIPERTGFSSADTSAQSCSPTAAASLNPDDHSSAYSWYVGSLQNLPTFSLPSLPSLQSLSSFARQPRGSQSQSNFNEGEPAMLGEGKKLYFKEGTRSVLILKRYPFVYVALYKEDESPVSGSYTRLLLGLEALARQLEGFSFAFLPSAPFKYVIADLCAKTAMAKSDRLHPKSTQEAIVLQDTLIAMLLDSPGECTARSLHNYWIYKDEIKPNVIALFWTPGSREGDAAMMRAAREWISNFKRISSSNQVDLHPGEILKLRPRRVASNSRLRH